MSGVVVVAGVFEPGSVVRLYSVADERVLRPEGDELVGTTLVDENGNVGWSELEVDGRYFAEGYVNGLYVLVRCRATDAEAAANLIQQPVQSVLPKVGTQEADQVPEAPAPPENADELPVGLPEGVQSPIIDQRPLFTHKGDGPIDTEHFVLTGQQTAAVEGSDGETVEPEALYRYVGPGDPSSDEWQQYEGASEDAAAPVAGNDSSPSSSGSTEPGSTSSSDAEGSIPGSEPKVSAGEATATSTGNATVELTTPSAAPVEPAAPEPVPPAESQPEAPADAPAAPEPDVAADPPASPEAPASGADQVAP